MFRLPSVFGLSRTAGRDGAAAGGNSNHRRLVSRHVRRCVAAAGRGSGGRNDLPVDFVKITAQLAMGSAASLPAPVAELVNMTLDELTP